MACNKIIVAVLFASLAIVGLTEAKNLTVGSHQFGDHPIQFDIVKKPSKWLQIVKEKRTFTGDGRSNITLVELIDNNKKGNGATPNVITGGPGFKFVTVEFKSQRGHSIDFQVNIYGK